MFAFALLIRLQKASARSSLKSLKSLISEGKSLYVYICTILVILASDAILIDKSH